MYKEVKVTERMPEMGKKVVVFDVEGNAITYAATEYGWHMPSLPNNIALDYWLEKVEESPYLYKDHDGNDVQQDQEIWSVKIKDWGTVDNMLWVPYQGKAIAALSEKELSHYAVFTTKEAAFKFINENRPFEFIAEDGKVYSEDQVIFLVNKEDFGIAKMRAKNVIVGIRHNNLAFVTKQAAKDHIKKHNAVLSLNMIEKEFIKNFGKNYMDTIYASAYTAIQELVNEQFKTD